MIFLLGIFIYNKIIIAKEFNDTEIWAHKAQKFSSDLLGIFNKVSEDKWSGSEIDIYLNKKDRNFYITHDYPDKSFLEYNKIEDLEKISNQKIWLDFKNLKESTVKETLILKKTLEKLSVKNEIFIESQNFIKLLFLKTENVTIIYNLPIFFENKFFLRILKLFMLCFHFENISVPIDNLSYVLKIFPPKSIYVFTVNSEDRICKLLENKSVAVILSDIMPININCNN